MPLLMKAPPNFGGFSAGGTKYEPDTKGEVWVGDAHIADAKSHGLTIVEGVEPLIVPTLVSLEDVTAMLRALLTLHGPTAVAESLARLLNEDDGLEFEPPPTAHRPVELMTRFELFVEAKRLTGSEPKATTSKRKLVEIVTAARGSEDFARIKLEQGGAGGQTTDTGDGQPGA